MTVILIVIVITRDIWVPFFLSLSLSLMLCQNVASTVSLHEITRDPADTTLLKHLDFKKGRVNFFFESATASGLETQEYRSEWSEFQAHKR